MMDMTTGLRHPKPPATTDRAARKGAQRAKDRRESEKVRVRSGGRCEVFVSSGYWRFDCHPGRCYRRAVHVHHMLSGHGNRLSAKGVEAKRKQHVCDTCHQDIEGGIGGKRLILQQSGDLPVSTDPYKRVR